MNDGEVTIGASLVTDKFDRQIAKFSKDLATKEEELNEKAKVKISGEETLKGLDEQFSKATDEVKKYNQELDGVKAKMRELDAAGQKITLTPEVNGMQSVEYTPQYAQLVEQQNILNAKIQEQKNLLSGIPELRQAEQTKLLQIEQEYNNINSKVQDIKTKINGIKLQKQQAEVQKMKEGFNGVGSSIQKAVKKASKLALGIFAIRSAYMALRRASSDLASYDEQYAANLEYIRYVLTQAIAPVLRVIVQIAAQLLGIINSIVSLFTGGKGFISESSVEDFMKMKNAASGTASAAKEIKKQMAGFDEMNVLQDNAEAGGGAGGGAVAPNLDFGEKPAWLEDILPILAGVITALALIKMGVEGIKALGIGIAVAGIVQTIKKLIDYLNDPSWENFGGIIQGIGLVILGLGMAIESVPAMVIGAVVLIVGTIVKYWEQVKGFLENAITWLTDQSDWVHEHLGDVIGNIYDGIVSAVKLVIRIFETLIETIKKIFDGLIRFFKGVFAGDWKEAWEGLKDIFGGIWEGIKNIVKNVWEWLKSFVVRIVTSIGNIVSSVFKGIINAILSAIENILNIPIRAINGLIWAVNLIPGVSLGYLDTFNLPRLKTGGIVNMPNRGTLVGGAIAGESGREGVIPLTDNQAMETLGNAIGRHVTINATVLNKMNGRVISRSLQQVQADSDFAYNT